MLESTSNQVLVAFRLEAVSFRDSKVFEGTTNSLRSSMSSWRFGGDYENCMKPIKITSEFYIDQIRNTTKNHKDMISYDGMTRHDTEFRGRSTIYQALQKVYKMRCIGVGGMTCDVCRANNMVKHCSVLVVPKELVSRYMNVNTRWYNPCYLVCAYCAVLHTLSRKDGDHALLAEALQNYS